MTVRAVFEFGDAVEFFADDPLAATLAGITLTNETTFTDPGADPGITGPDADARDLPTLLQQLG